MYSLEETVLIQSSLNFVRMLILNNPCPGSQLGQIGSKTRSNIEKYVNTLVGPVLIQSSKLKVHETLSEC